MIQFIQFLAWFVFLCFICHTDKVYDYNYKKDAKKLKAMAGRPKGNYIADVN